jgi:membrane-bound lytic murein transglycosylase A
LQPYADRAQIETGGIANAPVLFYIDDPIAFFFLQIQGSGRVVFDDGGTARIAYAGENGQPYTAIGRTLIADGALARDEVSLQSIRAWLIAHPERAAAVMQTNRSYIFFAQTPLGDTALGGTGSLGASLTPLASLAVDSRIHALGAPLYVAAEGPDPVHAIMVAQDVGGAIRGAARGDIFFGFGADAERRAGTLKASGTLYVLLPNALAAKSGAGRAFLP